MADTNTLLSNNDIISFLLRNSLQDDCLFLANHSQRIDFKNRQHVPVSLVNAIDIIRGNPNEADQVVWTIISQKRRGSSESFLELIDVLRVQAQDTPALILNTYALSIIENIGDLYATEIELLLQWTDALSVCPIVQDIISSKYQLCWSPRLGRSACNFFWHVAKNSPFEAAIEFVKKGLQCADDLQNKDALSEWGYYWEVRLLWLISPEKAAQKLSRYVVLAQPPPFMAQINDHKGELCCPRCCKMYITHILSKNLLAYHQIERIATKGYQDSFLLTFQDLSPTEQKEVAKLLSYFSGEIERIESFLKITSGPQERVPHEPLIRDTSLINTIANREKYEQKNLEED